MTPLTWIGLPSNFAGSNFQERAASKAIALNSVRPSTTRLKTTSPLGATSTSTFTLDIVPTGRAPRPWLSEDDPPSEAALEPAGLPGSGFNRRIFGNGGFTRFRGFPPWINLLIESSALISSSFSGGYSAIRIVGDPKSAVSLVVPKLDDLKNSIARCNAWAAF